PVSGQLSGQNPENTGISPGPGSVAGSVPASSGQRTGTVPASSTPVTDEVTEVFKAAHALTNEPNPPEGQISRVNQGPSEVGCGLIGWRGEIG
ncbi:MAG TPA: hypothetical protein VK503_06790, partial [Candidatus Bathyarchaeia archaeon]|nr:hypothetical protein [Candidatus Bathyarchaeia archaeon]